MKYPTRKDRRNYPYHRSTDSGCKTGACGACQRTNRLKRNLLDAESREMLDDYKAGRSRNER